MMLERAARRGGYVLAERSIAVDHNKDTTDYWDKQAWIRGKVDVTILYPTLGEAEVFDYKSSAKKKADAAQLKLYSASAITDYSEVQTVKSGFVWLNFKNDGPVDRPAVYSRAELDKAVNDGTITAANDGKTFGVGRPTSDVAAVLKAAGLSQDHLELSIQPLLVRSGRQVLLFDTGAGDAAFADVPLPH